MTVTAIVVTYGDRYHLLGQVVDALLREGVDAVWIADNASVSPSRERLHDRVAHEPKIRLFSFRENLGSAGAYYAVLQTAYTECQDGFFWFLDDDNLPLPGALAELKSATVRLKQDQGTPVLYSYRGHSWEEDRRAVAEGYEKGPVSNSFCGFHFRSLFKSRSRLGTKPFQVNFPVVPVKWGPYGGLFSSLANLRSVGLPRLELFLYEDDHDFTLRFHAEGIPQYLVHASTIEDLDQSVGEGGGYFSKETSFAKLYYGLRNTAFLSQQTITAPWQYRINKALFRVILLLLALKAFPKSPRLVWERMGWFWRALVNGERGILGKEPAL